MAEIELDMNAEFEEIFERIAIIMSDCTNASLAYYRKSNRLILKINN